MCSKVLKFYESVESSGIIKKSQISLEQTRTDKGLGVLTLVKNINLRLG